MRSWRQGFQRWRTGPLAGLALLIGSCSEAGQAPQASSQADAAVGDRAVAAELVEAAAELPLRAEVVALTDRLSIEASRRKGDEEASQLGLLAARLRERVWRLDRAASDAREAVELYGQVIRWAAGKAAACEADLRRARLLGELSRDAAQSYREMYLALERQSATPLDSDARMGCVRRLRAALGHAEAYRPTGADWELLQRQAAEAASAQLDVAAQLDAEDAGAAASAATSASSGLPPVAAGGQPVVVVPDAAMVGKEPAKLVAVQPYSYKLGGRVVLELSAPARYDTGVLDPDPASGRGHRIYLDLHDTRIKGPKKEIAAGGLVERVRLGKRKGGTRVVLDLTTDASRRIFYLPDPFRVVIDVSTRQPVAARPAVAAGKRDVRRVTLDPGHGGWDAGAIGPTGLREKDVALDIAHRAAPALADELGIETMLTRDTDVYVELVERTARANAFQSDLFVSIHCNATENGEATGVEVFALDPSRVADQRVLRAVARENQRSRRGSVLDPKMLDAQLTNIAAGLGMGDSSSQSRLLAELLRKSTLASLDGRYSNTHDHGVKTASFFVLLGAEMPAALYETAFISNPDDEARLGTADFRQKLADAVVNAIRAYRDGVR